MGVQDRFEHDPVFKSLVDMLSAFLMNHPDITPTELREAAMCAATRVEAMTLRDFYFAPDGTLVGQRQRPR
jgi:hypothetical protein